jgi:hypothetical protein
VRIAICLRTSRKSSAITILLVICRQETPMLDIIMLAMGLGFFALSVGYAYACDRL